MEFKDRLKDLRNEKGVSQEELGKVLGYEHATISQYESGKRKPDFDTLHKIADYFNVTTDYLLGRTNKRYLLVKCSVCGFNYELPTDKEEHKEYHKKYLKAVEKYGFCYHYREREKMKRQAYSVIKNNVAPFQDKLKAAKVILKAYFSRSLEGNDFNLNHPLFPEYASMLLNQTNTEKSMPMQVYKALVEEYGIKPGIKNGSSYWEPGTEDVNDNGHPISEEDLTPTSIPGYNEPTGKELESILRESNIQFEGAPLDEEDKQDILDFLKMISKRKPKKES